VGIPTLNERYEYHSLVIAKRKESVAQLAKRQSATSLDISPDQERHSRMVKYTVAMSVRMVCIVAGVFTQGWLMWVFFSLAIFLPYFAVIIANAHGSTPTKDLSTVVAPKITLTANDIRIADEK
jgi:hypothetical protein